MKEKFSYLKYQISSQDKFQQLWFILVKIFIEFMFIIRLYRKNINCIFYIYIFLKKNIYWSVLLNNTLFIIIVGEVLHITVNNWLVKGLLDRLQEEKSQEKIVNCEVLHDPGSELRKADIIFVHGIKGALEKTWTQGGWGLTRFQVKMIKYNFFAIIYNI